MTISIDLECPEDDCDGMLVYRPEGNWGPWYGCAMWVETGCKGAHGCHADGTPLGVPANTATKQARMRAHKAFDALWKREEGGTMRRKDAYAWLQKAMGLSADETHIGRFNEEQCAQVCTLVKEKGGTDGR
tara:strand:- start:421 stop:813 length:393 start_codon:yes stop_codon:yes gene_type:complete